MQLFRLFTICYMKHLANYCCSNNRTIIYAINRLYLSKKDSSRQIFLLALNAVHIFIYNVKYLLLCDFWSYSRTDDSRSRD